MVFKYIFFFNSTEIELRAFALNCISGPLIDWLIDWRQDFAKLLNYTG